MHYGERVRVLQALGAGKRTIRIHALITDWWPNVLAMVVLAVFIACLSACSAVPTSRGEQTKAPALMTEQTCGDLPKDGSYVLLGCHG